MLPMQSEIVIINLKVANLKNNNYFATLLSQSISR